jgi:DNA polymerase III gamma/tau subunit
METSTIGANNSLLKMLEEPAADTFLILLSEHPKRLLPTILSRVQMYHILPVTKKERERIFEDHFFADYHHYQSIEQFVLSKADIPLQEIQAAAESFISSIISRQPLNSIQLGQVCTLVDEKNHLNYFISMVESKLSSLQKEKKISTNQVIAMYKIMNESFQKAEVYNQQRKVLVEMIYYRLLGEL